MDIIAMFHNSYKDVETYQKNRLVKLPEDLAFSANAASAGSLSEVPKTVGCRWANLLESPSRSEFTRAAAQGWAAVKPVHQYKARPSVSTQHPLRCL